LRGTPILSISFFLISLLSYQLFLETHADLLQAVSSILFFSAISLPLIRWTLRNVSRWRDRTFFLIFFPYLIFHYYLFSFLVVGYLPPPVLPSRFGIGFSYPSGTLIDMPYVDSESPALWFVQGSFLPSLTPFQLLVGFLVASLLAANLSASLKLRKALSKTKLSAIGFLPGLAAVSATSCCLAIPTVLLVSIAASVASITSTILSVLASPLYFWLVYFGLPILSIFVLAISLTHLNKALSLRPQLSFRLLREK